MTGQKIKILLVEDNLDDTRLIQEELAESMDFIFDINNFQRLSLAIDFLKENKVDLILLDLGLPDSSGMDTFYTIFNEARNIPIIILSGLKDEILALNAVSKGAQDYLVKSETDSANLIRSIRHSIERHKVFNELWVMDQLFFNLAENLDEIILVLNMDGSIVFASNKFVSLALGGETLVGRNIFEFLHDANIDQIKSSISNLQKTKLIQNENLKFKSLLPEEVNLSALLFPIISTYDNLQKILIVSKQIV